MDKKLTQEELNGLSPRARKAYEDSNTVLSEITTENPRKQEPEDKKCQIKREESSNARKKFRSKILYNWIHKKIKLIYVKLYIVYFNLI